MTTYRPTFRVSPPIHGGGTSTIIGNTFRHRRPRTRSRMSPTMRLLTKSRDLDQTGRALASLNKIMEKETQALTSHLPSQRRPHELRREKFEDFTSRIMKGKSEGALSLGPEMQAALLGMSSEIRPLLPGWRQFEQKLSCSKSKNANNMTNTKSNVDPQGQGQNGGGSKTNVAGNVDEETEERPSPSMMDHPSPFVTTFGNGVGRASLGDLESFQKRNKLWKSTLKSTLQYLEQPTPTQSGQGSEVIVKSPIETAPHQKSSKRHGQKDKVSVNTVRIQASTDLNRILQRGSMLLMASAALKPKQSKPLKEKVVDLERGAENNNLIEYSPPSKSFLEKMKNGVFKLPIYDRIESKRERVLKKGFEFEKVEDEITTAVRNVAQEMKHTFGMGSYTKTRPKTTKPFEGIKMSKLVGYNAATAQEKREFDKNDVMNPLQLKLVQGLQDGELSSFLENHGRRRQEEIGMQIIPGMAPDPGQHQKTFKSERQRSFLRQPPRRSYVVEPRFRTLPQNLLNRVALELSTVKKTSQASGMSREVKTGFPNQNHNSFKLNLKMNAYLNKEPLQLSPHKVVVGKTKTPNTLHDLKTTNLKDITKTEFIREMRKQQGQLLKSKK